MGGMDDMNAPGPIMAIEDESGSVREVLKCSRCKTAAHVVHREGPGRVECPTCHRFVDFDKARDIIRNRVRELGVEKRNEILMRKMPQLRNSSEFRRKFGRKATQPISGFIVERE